LEMEVGCCDYGLLVDDAGWDGVGVYYGVSDELGVD